MTVRPLHRSDLPAVNRLHREVWWPQRSPAGWRWLEDNPARGDLGAPLGWVLEGANGAAAFVGNFVQRFWINNRRLHGATGFSIIVPPDQKGRSRDLIHAFMAQPGCFLRYTLNANPRSSPLYRRYGLSAWPPETHDRKLSWVINPAACLYGRGLRALVAREPRAARWLGEQLTPRRPPRAPSEDEAAARLPPGVSILTDLTDRSPYGRFWEALRGQGRLIADRSPAMMRWRTADPDLTVPPLHLAHHRDGEITAYALALLAKGNSIEPPTLEIIDLVALDRDPTAIHALTRGLLTLAPGLGAAKVRLQVVNAAVLEGLGDLARRARHEGGWGHGHAAFAPDAAPEVRRGWRPTPFDGDYSFCVRPLPLRSCGTEPMRAEARAGPELSKGGA